MLRTAFGRSILKTVFGSIENWRNDRRCNPNPRKRNAKIMKAIKERFPGFSPPLQLR